MARQSIGTTLEYRKEEVLEGGTCGEEGDESEEEVRDGEGGME
jgi:hypothetical protein